MPDRSRRHRGPGRFPGSRQQTVTGGGHAMNQTNAQLHAEIAELEEALCGISARMGALMDLNSASPLRRRALPIALTNLETGTLWLEEAIREVKEQLEDEEVSAA